MKAPSFEIGGTAFSLLSEQHLRLPEGLNPFLVDREGEVSIEARTCGDLPAVESLGRLLFDSGSIWRIYQCGDRLAFVFNSPALGPAPYRLLTHTKGTTRYEIQTRIGAPQASCPLEHPLLQLLLISHLSEGQGALVHACGIDLEGKGVLFVGNSGAGKSTLASLWAQEVGVLNDDRIVVRNGEMIEIYGTPWHGKVEAVRREGVPLAAVFFLTHGTRNEAVPVESARAVTNFIRCTRFALWDRQGVDFALRFYGRVVSEVPCYELAFVPDSSALKCIKTLIG